MSNVGLVVSTTVNVAVLDTSKSHLSVTVYVTVINPVSPQSSLRLL